MTTNISKAICIPFHRYVPHVNNDHYRVYYKFLLEQVKDWNIDTLYLIDSDMAFDEDFKDKLASYVNYKIIPKENEGHHWVQFKTALPHIVEDYCLFMDNDVVFTDHTVVNKWFDMAKDVDLVTAFDSSGGLRDLVHEKFPFMKEIDATRMGSYYFVANRKVMEMMKEHPMEPIYYPYKTRIEELDYTTKLKDWSDSFGLLTIKMLGKGIDIKQIEDPRETIYYGDTGEYNKNPETPVTQGYYHIRNGNLPVYMLDSEGNHKEHVYKITPRQEAIRILAWWYYCSERAGYDFENDIKEMLDRYEMDVEEWEKYYQVFKEYHNL